MANPIVADAQLVLAAAQLQLDAPPLGSLNEQPEDQRRLRDRQNHGTDDVALVLIPDARLSKQYANSVWNTRLVDPPAPQLAPIDLVEVRVERGHRYVVDSLSAKHAKRERGDGLRLRQLIAAIAADDARFSGGVRPAVRRRVGRGRDARQGI